MENKEVTSKQFSLNWKDVLRSLVLAVGTPLLFKIQKIVDSGVLEFDWKELSMIALGAAITYLFKNFVTKPAIKTPIENKDVAELKDLPTAAK